VEKEEMRMMDRRSKWKHREEPKKKLDYRKRRGDRWMIRRKKWRIRRSRKPCLKNNRKKRRIEKDKKPKLLDKDSSRNRRKLQREQKNKQLKLQQLLRKTILLEMKKSISKKRSNSNNHHLREDLITAMAKMALSLSKQRKCSKRKMTTSQTCQRVVQEAVSKS
jgi:hypothetical protein